MRRRLLSLCLAPALALAACGDEPATTPDAADAAAEVDVTEPDADGDVPSEDDTGADATEDVEAETTADVEADVDPGPPALVLQATIAAPAADPLTDAEVVSCPVYLDERCEDGQRLRCDLYDTGAASWADAPDPLLRRAYLYDRWYDRFSSPDGQTAERLFKVAMPGDAPEEVWTSAEAFAGWAGEGDSAIWTGAALNAAIYRYAATGTEADYARMEAKVRDLVLKFDVTGIPGYLARYHFLLMPPGGPQSDQHVLRHEDTSPPKPRDNPIEAPEAIAGLPAAYLDGVPDSEGTLVKGVPYWNGHPSIDQYSGPMMTFPIAWHLVKDEALKGRMAHHLTCYLKRLERLEIINLQANPEVLEAMTSYFGGGVLQLDPDDVDLTQIDRIVGYYHAGFNAKNADTFDRTCPDTLPTTPTRVLDAASDSFFLDMIDLASDLQETQVRPGQIDHFYAPSVRGGDASHMIHLAVMAFMMTGDEQYRSFLFDELVDEVGALEVARTMMAFRLPDWCFKFYGDHITYTTHWQLITMLADSPLRDAMVEVMAGEAWDKALKTHHSALFGVMFGSSVTPEQHPDVPTAIAQAVAQLQAFGGNDGVLDAPRRTYTRTRQEIIDALPEGLTLRCPTEEERTQCEDGGDLFGIPLESKPITFTCDGRPGECVMADGKCANALASHGLPPDLRIYGDFQWQRSPFDIGDLAGLQGAKQSPGRDLAEPYWMARHYGFITEGAGTVLAWRPAGDCE